MGGVLANTGEVARQRVGVRRVTHVTPSADQVAVPPAEVVRPREAYS
jgi:hypothetical protein